MPVLEVVVAAVSHEVPAPDCTDLADQTIANNLAKDSDNGHVAHIVSNIERSPGSIRGLKHAIGTFNGDGDGLFQVDSNPGFEQLACDVFMSVIGAGDNCCINSQVKKLFQTFYPRMVTKDFTSALAHCGVGITPAD